MEEHSFKLVFLVKNPQTSSKENEQLTAIYHKDTQQQSVV